MTPRQEYGSGLDFSRFRETDLSRSQTEFDELCNSDSTDDPSVSNIQVQVEMTEHAIASNMDFLARYPEIVSAEFLHTFIASAHTILARKRDAS